MENKTSQEYPIKEQKYTQQLEEMKLLIDYLKEHMRPCPSDDIIFNLIEVVDYYNLKRNFKLKSKSDKNNSESINKFKESLLNDISSLETFIVIPSLNQIGLEVSNNKGKKVKFPKVFDINGEATKFVNKDTIIFLFDN